MATCTLALGSLAQLAPLLTERACGELPTNADVVVVPTAAAFTGGAEAAVAVARALEGMDLHVEALLVMDRTSASDPYFVQRIAEADLVVLSDGSALHARTVWRGSPVGDAINASDRVVAVGGVATVLGDVMIDPRGGAPTIGLGYRSGVILCTLASSDQLARTRALLSSDDLLVTLGPRGAVSCLEGVWRLVRSDDAVVTRGSELAIL